MAVNGSPGEGIPIGESRTASSRSKPSAVLMLVPISGSRSNSPLNAVTPLTVPDGNPIPTQSVASRHAARCPPAECPLTYTARR